MKKLNLGCGKDIKEGYINLDIVSLEGVDVVADIEKELPFEDNYFDEVYSDNVLEHVENLDMLLKELHRICKKEGLIHIIVPHFSFFGSYTDPTHKRFFGYNTFDYFTKGSDYNFYSNIEFDIVDKQLQYYWLKNKQHVIKGNCITFVINSIPLFYERFLCWIFPVQEVYVTLRPNKK